VDFVAFCDPTHSRGDLLRFLSSRGLPGFTLEIYRPPYILSNITISGNLHLNCTKFLLYLSMGDISWRGWAEFGVRLFT